VCLTRAPLAVLCCAAPRTAAGSDRGELQIFCDHGIVLWRVAFGFRRRYHLRAATKELRDKWLDKLRENWTAAEAEGSGSGGVGYRGEDGSWEDDGRSAEARRFKSMRFSDGGTVANNPTFIALQEAWALYGAPGSSLHEFVGRQVDCVVSIGTGDPPPRRVREHMGFKELIWEVLEHHTTSRDVDVVLSQVRCFLAFSGLLWLWYGWPLR
jgi:hypothetical protein